MKPSAIAAIVGLVALAAFFGYLAGKGAGGPVSDPRIRNFCTTGEQLGEDWSRSCVLSRNSGACAADDLYKDVCLTR